MSMDPPVELPGDRRRAGDEVARNAASAGMATGPKSSEEYGAAWRQVDRHRPTGDRRGAGRNRDHFDARPDRRTALAETSGPGAPAGVAVTLLTGARVIVSVMPDGRQASTVVSADRAGRHGFRTWTAGRDLHVVPDDVAPLVGRVLDRGLFNVSRLIRDGYDTDACRRVGRVRCEDRQHEPGQPRAPRSSRPSSGRTAAGRPCGGTIKPAPLLVGVSPVVVELGDLAAPTEPSDVVTGDGRRCAVVCVVAARVLAGRLDDGRRQQPRRTGPWPPTPFAEPSRTSAMAPVEVHGVLVQHRPSYTRDGGGPSLFVSPGRTR
jgi:hypothetical protein